MTIIFDILSLIIFLVAVFLGVVFSPRTTKWLRVQILLGFIPLLIIIISIFISNVLVNPREIWIFEYINNLWIGAVFVFLFIGINTFIDNRIRYNGEEINDLLRKNSKNRLAANKVFWFVTIILIIICIAVYVFYYTGYFFCFEVGNDQSDSFLVRMGKFLIVSGVLMGGKIYQDTLEEIERLNK